MQHLQEIPCRPNSERIAVLFLHRSIAIIVPNLAKEALKSKFAGFLLQNRPFSFRGSILSFEEVL